MMKKKKNQKKWTKFRHRIIRNLAFPIFHIYSKLKYGIKVEKFREQKKGTPYLILFNHQTAFDQFFVGMAFKGPVYYLATEDLFSNGFVSSLLRYAVAPIPIKKQATDITAIKNCIRVAKEGGTIAIAPEGNRTYSGETCYISPAIISLAKKLNLPIALYRIEGGYGVQPRWSDVTRKGKMRSYVSKVIEPEEYSTMSDDELFALVEKELYIDESKPDAIFESKKKAEYLERAMYVCPFCKLTTFESHGNEIECKQCGRKVSYGSDKQLKGIGFDFPFETVLEWYKYQENFINELDTGNYTETPLYNDNARVSEVIVYKHKNVLRKWAEISLYGDRIVIDENTSNSLAFPFSEITAISVLGRNKLNIYHNKKIYQFKSDRRFNALKYVNIYYRNKNIVRGDTVGKFLGL
ncbi:MAG: 1-acyl-sn-glycerol-3-phosphate acyltransferase [Clostridia bacterium]|nr:1-acyl-sn-glycerol-3-phosphate acyltransferase [Clostridia bacterium]